MKPAAGEIVRMDPYANLTVEGKAVKMIKRTPADKDGGFDPVWESEIYFDIVDQYLIDLEIFNQNLIGKDILLGSTQISLLNVFRSGVFESWLSLKQKKANGGIKAVGDIFVRLVFTGMMIAMMMMVMMMIMMIVMVLKMLMMLMVMIVTMIVMMVD
jgi:hypothetical protein